MAINKGYIPAGGETSAPRLADAIRQLWQNAASQDAVDSVAAAEIIVSSASSALTAERVLTDTATVTWDFSVAGQAKATATGAITPYAFSAHRNGTNQTGLATGTYTKILFTNEDFDAQGVFDTTNSKYTPLGAGKYLIQLAIGFNSMTAGALFIASIYKNGTEIKQFFTAAGAVTGPAGYGGACIIEMNGTTDNLEFYTYHENGSNATLAGAAKYTYASGIRLIT